MNQLLQKGMKKLLSYVLTYKKINLLKKSLTCLDVSHLSYTPVLTQQSTNSVSDQEKIMEMFQSHFSVLLSDFKGISGLEFKNVIVAVDADEYYLRQLVVDVISRCTCNLVIILFNKKPESVEGECLRNVINKWRENDLVHEVQVGTCSCNLNKLYCYNQSSYNIHLNSDQYQQMMEICNEVVEVKPEDIDMEYHLEICKR